MTTSRLDRRKKKNAINSEIIFAAVAVVLILAGFCFKFMDKSNSSDECRQAMYVQYERECPHVSRATIKQLVDRYHDQCFSKCFTIGGHRQSNKFNVERYARMMDEAIVPHLPAPP